MCLIMLVSVLGPTLIGLPPAAAGPTISAVGSLATAEGSGLTTLSVDPQTAGDLLGVSALTSTSSLTVSSISGGGVATWTKAVQFDGSIGGDEEIWYGKVTTTGSSSITFTWSGSVTSHTQEYSAQEFTAGLGSATVWSLDKTGTVNNSSSTSVSYPSLTPSGSGELYFGYSCIYNTPSAGSTTGFSYAMTAENNLIAYNPNVSGAVSPTASQSPAGISSSVGVLFTASHAISAVGSLATAEGSGLTTLSVDPQTAGDLLGVSALTSTSSLTVSSISGGGVATWTKAVQFDGSIGGDEEIWYGKVTTTGSSSITFTWSGSVTSHTQEYSAQEFTAGLGSATVWSLDKTGTVNNSSSTSVSYPSLTPSGSGELYFGYSCIYNTPSAGSTTGFSYAMTAENNLIAYNPNVSGAVSPTASQSPAGISSSVGVLFTATNYQYRAPSVVGDAYSLAGTGAAGTSGNNGQATEAEFNDPVSSAVDSAGNVYVADESNSRIQEIAGTTHSQWGISMTAGDIYTIAGSSSGSSGSSGDGGVATSSLLDLPSGVAVDAAGNLYIADQGNNRIQFVAASNCSSSCPWGLSSTTANDIYTVAGSSSGSSGHSGDGGGATSALLNQPRNVAFDAAGNLYIDDTNNNRVQVVSKISCSSKCPFGLSSTAANDIYTVAGSASGSSGSSGDGGRPPRPCSTRSRASRLTRRGTSTSATPPTTGSKRSQP